jgi:hypothetical protein
MRKGHKLFLWGVGLSVLLTIGVLALITVAIRFPPASPTEFGSWVRLYVLVAVVLGALGAVSAILILGGIHIFMRGGIDAVRRIIAERLDDDTALRRATPRQAPTESMGMSSETEEYSRAHNRTYTKEVHSIWLFLLFLLLFFPVFIFVVLPGSTLLLGESYGLAVPLLLLPFILIFAARLLTRTEDAKDSEKQQLERYLEEKRKLVSSKSYVYVEDLVKKHGGHGAPPDKLGSLEDIDDGEERILQDERSLHKLLEGHGFHFQYEEVGKLLTEEIEEQKFRHLKARIAQRSPVEVADYIRAFVEIYSDDEREDYDTTEREDYLAAFGRLLIEEGVWTGDLDPERFGEMIEEADLAPLREGNGNA